MAALAHAALPDDRPIEDDYWMLQYRSGKATLAQVLEAGTYYEKVAGEVIRSGDRGARRRIVEALAAPTLGHVIRRTRYAVFVLVF